jgi:two-component system cell cycle response regulator CpdR
VICSAPSWRRPGDSILLAEDGQQALALAEQADKGTPLVLLTDVLLPGINGHDLAKEFLQRYPLTRVGFVTGWFDQDLISLGICPNCSCILRKPFELSDLRRFVDKILSQPVCEELFHEAADQRTAAGGGLPIHRPHDSRPVRPASKDSP